jgi:serine/threonine protein kinase
MRVAPSLSHPNVVTVFDAIEHEGAVLLVMEYVDGPSLAQRMGDGPLPGARRWRSCARSPGAVDHLHDAGRHPPRHQAREHAARPRRPR